MENADHARNIILMHFFPLLLLQWPEIQMRGCLQIILSFRFTMSHSPHEFELQKHHQVETVLSFFETSEGRGRKSIIESEDSISRDDPGTP